MIKAHWSVDSSYIPPISLDVLKGGPNKWEKKTAIPKSRWISHWEPRLMNRDSQLMDLENPQYIKLLQWGANGATQL